MHLFSSRYEPLDRPPPLSPAGGSTLDSPDLQRVREIQHDADNAIMAARARRHLRQRPDAFTEGLRDAWRGDAPR